MSLRFPYQAEPLAGPAPPSLSPGAMARYRPLVPLRIRAPATGLFRDYSQALVDTGADDTIFPLSIAQVLNVSLLPDVPVASSIRWRGSRYPIRFGSVLLEVSDGRESWSWPALVAFTAAPIRYPLLGQAGCLQYLTVTFFGPDRSFSSTPLRASRERSAK